MPDARLHGSLSNILRFPLRHATTGDGLTGLTHNSSGLIISTIADNEASATSYVAASPNTIHTISALGTYAAPPASGCRFREVDATNHPGLYEFQFADARFAVSDAKKLVIAVSGASNLLDEHYEIDLVRFHFAETEGNRLRRALLGTIIGTVGNGSSATLVVASQIDPAVTVADQFLGKVLTFDKNTTTAALRGQSTRITDVAAGSPDVQITVDALTTTPASGDTFSIS